MTFKFAKCETCNTYIFDESRIISYRLCSRDKDGNRQKEIVQLEGREPWAGIRCICLDCVDFFTELRKQWLI